MERRRDVSCRSIQMESFDHIVRLYAQELLSPSNGWAANRVPLLGKSLGVDANWVLQLWGSLGLEAKLCSTTWGFFRGGCNIGFYNCGSLYAWVEQCTPLGAVYNDFSVKCH